MEGVLRMTSHLTIVVYRQTDSVYLSSVETYDYKYNCIQNKKNSKTKYPKGDCEVTD